MSAISFELPDPVSIAIAMSRGWTPQIDDTSQPMVDDEYPQIPNPVTHGEFVSKIAPMYLTESVVRAGREQVLDAVQSRSSSVQDAVQKGQFDGLIVEGRVGEIMDAIRAQIGGES